MAIAASRGGRLRRAPGRGHPEGARRRWPGGRWSPGACGARGRGSDRARRDRRPARTRATSVAAVAGRGRAGAAVTVVTGGDEPLGVGRATRWRRAGGGGRGRSSTTRPGRSRRPSWSTAASSGCEHWGCDGVVAAARAVDTIKEADAGGRVIGDARAQQPVGGADAAGVRAELAAPGARRAATSSAPTTTRSWSRRSGGDVRDRRGAAPQLKVTTPLDLRIAELLLARHARRLMLTDYHTHLRPDDPDTPPSYFTEANVRPLPRGGGERGIAELGFSEHVYRFRQALDVWRHPFWEENARRRPRRLRRVRARDEAAGHR